MAQIVIKIPTGSSSHVEGECALHGYERMLLAEQVSYDVTVDSEFSAEGRRTVHIPKMSVVSIQRKVDIATAELTRFVLLNRVSTKPWEIYFLRDLGGGPEQVVGGVAFHLQQLRYMTLKLHKALVTKQDVSFDEGDLVESLEVSAGSVEWEYNAYDDQQRPRGKLGFKFDAQAGTLS